MSSTTLEMAADFESIRALGSWLRTTMEHFGIDTTDNAFVSQVELAIHELATNSIDHASAQKILIDAKASPNELTINLTDDGVVQFEPTSAPVEPQVRGYGIMIVEQLAQSVQYHRSAQANQWELRFALQPEHLANPDCT